MDLTGSPYYDTAPTEKNSGYVRVLSVPGRVVQSRELSLVQRLTQLQLKDIADSLFRDGAVIEGCQIGVQGTTVLVSAGKIYFQGFVIPVPQTVLTITGSGTEIVGIDITESIVTENTDPTLRDPAFGFLNYGQPGAHRLKLTAEVVVKESPTVHLCEIRDGVVYYDSTPPPEFYKIVEIMAKRTFDESGNYVVEGMNVSWSGEEDENKLYLSLEKGRAYVEGYEVVNPVNTPFAVDKALDTETIFDEPFTYQSSVNQYYLRDQPVKQILTVEGVVQITNYITRGSVPGGLDDLRPYQPRTPTEYDQITSPVVEILSITGYTKNVDWVQNGNYVDWSPSGNEPSPGASYQCTWTYKKKMVPEDKYPNQGDFTVTVDSNGNSYLSFTDHGDKPINNSTVEVTYDFFLSRHDFVYINKEGQIIVSKGIPNFPKLAKPTLIKDTRLLPLALLIVSPNPSTPVVITNNTIRRMTMEKINKLLTRLENLEFNQAMDDLDREAAQNEQATLLRGILTEGFIGYSKVDLHHPLFESKGCALDFDTQSMTNLQLLQQTNPTIKSSGTTATVHRSIITLPYTHVVAATQPYATQYLNLNAYNFFNAGAQLVLTPSIDNWVETIQVISGIRTDNINVGVMRRWWSPHMSKDWYRELALRDKETLRQLGIDVDNLIPVGRSTQTYASRGALISDKITTEAVPYARANTIQLYGYNFVPSTDNLVLKCRNTTITAYPQSSTYQGTQSGTLRADTSGIVRGSFVFPGNTFPCGTHPITLSNSNNYAETTYTSIGTRRIESYIFFGGTVTVRWTDPVAQSFGFTEDTVITRVGLFFKSKDSTKPVVVEVKNMVNGYPGTTVYARKELFPSQISISNNASAETVVTFDEPIYCEKDTQYCISLRTDSNSYHIWYAELGGKNVTTNTVVTANPYIIGTLFTSSNNETWVANPSADLKMKLYRANFTTSATLLYNAVASTLSAEYNGGANTYTGFNRICIMAEEMTPDGTAIDWYYGYQSGNQTIWKPIYPYEDIELDTILDNISIKAVLRGTNTITPFINKDTVVFAGLLTTEESYYITRNVVFPAGAEFNKVKQILEVKVPTGCSFHVDYALDTTGTTWEHQSETRTPDSVENIGEGFYRYTFIDTLDDDYTDFRGLIKIKTNHPTNRVVARRFMNILTNDE